MKKYSVFIAVSKDGFIANENGSIEFLNNLNIIGDAGYKKYYDSIDALVYGSKTYKTIKNFKLKKWPYDKPQYVLSKEKNMPFQNIVFYNGLITDLDNLIKEKNIWVMGGANVIKQYLEKNMIDFMNISYVNLNLKKGIKLFENKLVLNQFKITKKENFGDIESITYKKIFD